MKKIIIISFSNKGALLSKQLESVLPEFTIDNYCYYKYASNFELLSFESAKKLVKENFNNYDYLIFIGALGIAVREIAPYIKSKTIDPGVVVMDERGHFVISVLSGHIGLANELTRLIAKRTGAEEVITTATDINKRFSLDEWATKKEMHISSMKLAKDLAAEILNHDIAFSSIFEVKNELPSGLMYSKHANMGLSISYLIDEPYPFTLYLIPKVLSVGIGCKRGISMENIKEVLLEVFDKYHLQVKGIKQIASIDLKKDENGIIEVAKSLNVPFITFSKEVLNNLQGEFSASEFVKQTTGVDSVCERSAVCACNFGKLLVKKYAKNGVTIAVGIEDYILEF